MGEGEIDIGEGKSSSAAQKTNGSLDIITTMQKSWRQNSVQGKMTFA